jgi:hypothetical protein
VFRLETRADTIFFLVLSLAVGTLGALMLAFPTQPLPEDRQAYRAVGGVLRALKDESPRRGTWVVFALEGSDTRYVAALPPAREASRSWVVGQTTLQFFVLKARAADMTPVHAYGLRADAREVKSLQQDIAFHNAGVNPWGGLMALTIGILGTGTALLRGSRLPGAPAGRPHSGSPRKGGASPRDRQ